MLLARFFSLFVDLFRFPFVPCMPRLCCAVVSRAAHPTALYDAHTGFTASRNGPAAYRFMMEHLHFPDEASAKTVRDEYFARYHSTVKGLQMA